LGKAIAFKVKQIRILRCSKDRLGQFCIYMIYLTRKSGDAHFQVGWDQMNQSTDKIGLIK